MAVIVPKRLSDIPQLTWGIVCKTQAEAEKLAERYAEVYRWPGNLTAYIFLGN